MGLFSKLFGNNEAAEDKRSAPVATSTSQAAKKASVKYADSRSVSPDERAFYKPDDYYTLEKPGISSPVRVITFEEGVLGEREFSMIRLRIDTRS